MLGLLIALSVPAVATAGDCDIEAPATIDRGFVQSLGLRCDEPFIGLVQISLTQDFASPISLSVQASDQEGSDHRVTVEFRTPWNVDTFLDKLFVRGFALLNSGPLLETNGRRVDVGKGRRVFESVTPDRGLLAIEMEFEEDIEEWKERTVYGGFSGTGYLQWKGSNHYNDKSHGVIDYHFEVTRGGEYALALHCFHWGGHLHNDVWMKFDTGSWEKVYSAAEGVWSWKAEKEGGSVFKEHLDAGLHTLTIAARSEKFCIDRMHLFHTGDYSRGEVEDLRIPISTHHYE